MEEDIRKIPTGVKAAANAVMSLTNADDPIFRMLKIEPIANMVRLPPLPTQLIQRKIPEDKPERSKSERSKSVIKESEELTEAQRYNMANPLGLVMFGAQVDPPLALKPPEPEPTASFENGSSIFKVPAVPALSSAGTKFNAPFFLGLIKLDLAVLESQNGLIIESLVSGCSYSKS